MTMSRLVEFKRKLSDAEVGMESAKAARPPPDYGTLRYWEDRYSQQFRKVLQSQGQTLKTDGPDEQNNDPFAWYFNYSELRPIILPLIIEEADEDDSSARGGLAVSGPIGVLEIGCGDSPLGGGLAEEILAIEYQTGAKHSDIINRVVCCDYSRTVIEVLRKQYMRAMGPDKDSNGLIQVDLRDFPLSFEVIDARDLPYEDESFHLILEKGALDAMMSDAVNGSANCLRVLAECGRVLEYRGYFVVVSHQNEEAASGKRWVEGVLYHGLQTVSGANWVVEIHKGGYAWAPPGMVGPAVYVIQKTRATSVDDGGIINVEIYSY